MSKKVRAPIFGERFGRLTVLGEAPGRRSAHYIFVRRDCGTVKQICWYPVLHGAVTSCGCYCRDRARTHGMSQAHPVYRIWKGMRLRCENAQVAGFRYYGGRGIRVCERWQSFEMFWTDMGPPWRPGLTLNRIDNDRNYEPDNCHWATRAEQARNTRRAILVGTPWGRLCIKQAARAYGVNHEAFRRHYHAGTLDQFLPTIRGTQPQRDRETHRRGEHTSAARRLIYAASHP